MAKKSTFIDVELRWAEDRLAEWKQFIDENPIHRLKDRKDLKRTKTGGSYEDVVATIEQQGKYIQEMMKNYLALLGEVDKLREKEEQKKIQARGDQEISPFESGDI